MLFDVFIYLLICFNLLIYVDWVEGRYCSLKICLENWPFLLKIIFLIKMRFIYFHSETFDR